MARPLPEGLLTPRGPAGHPQLLWPRFTQTLTTCKRDLRGTACLCVQQPKSMENPLRGGREGCWTCDLWREGRGCALWAKRGRAAGHGSRCARLGGAPVGDRTGQPDPSPEETPFCSILKFNSLASCSVPWIAGGSLPGSPPYSSHGSVYQTRSRFPRVGRASPLRGESPSCWGWWPCRLNSHTSFPPPGAHIWVGSSFCSVNNTALNVPAKPPSPRCRIGPRQAAERGAGTASPDASPVA